MKYKLFLIILLLTSFKFFSQTTFTFNGIGNWTDVTKWSLGNYPGTTIDASEVVEIYGKATIATGTTVINNGSILSFSSANGDTPELSIIGGLINNKNINLSSATISVSATGTITTNNLSDLIITNNSILTNLGNISILGGTVSVNSSVSSILNNGNGTINNFGMLKVLSGSLENNSMVNNPIINSGQILVSNGTIINRSQFLNNSNGNLLIFKTFSNQASGLIENNGFITINGFGSSLTNIGNFINNNNLSLEDSARLNLPINSGSFLTSGTVNITSNSIIENSSTNFTIDNGIIKNEGTINNNTTMVIDGLGQLENNGALNNNFGGQLINDGILSGINTAHSGSFVNESILEPGNVIDQTGLYKLDSFFTSYTQTSNGSLFINLAGNIAGDSYDQVVVNRDATLNGTLNVSLLNGFEPNMGDVFTILREGRNLSGTFSSVLLPILSGGKVWNAVEYNNTDGVRISVSTTLGVSNIDDELLELKIYPNPVIDKIFISGLKSNVQAIIIDTKGRKILEENLSNINSNIYLVDIPKGIYFLKLENHIFKFVKI